MERFLDMELSDMIDMFQRFKWKFYEVEAHVIRVEVPRSQDTLVVLLENTEDNIFTLKAEGFINQKKGWAN